MPLPTTAPVLSTPAEHIFEDPTPATVSTNQPRLSEEQLYIQYEIQRTVAEIREGRWKSIALQFPDEMLVDAPRVFERLRDGLREGQRRGGGHGKGDEVSEAIDKMERVDLNGGEKAHVKNTEEDVEEVLYILADTSHGACCVDEIAAEHVDADVVVHYGRACLSPTARLPVIYVFTSPPLDLEAALASFKATYPDKSERVCLMADIPYAHHIPPLHQHLRSSGYENLFATEVLHDPSSLLPNRTVPPEAQKDPETLKSYSIFHISEPPTALLLIVSSRVRSFHIYLTTPSTATTTPTTQTKPITPLLRRRYALLSRLPSLPILGILINTLSISSYQSIISHVERLISRAGKKSHTIIVGKINPAKLANFAEVGAWVVVGCWESCLIDSGDFLAPVVTPFECEVALGGAAGRVWGGEWVGDWRGLLDQSNDAEDVSVEDSDARGGGSGGNWEDQISDDEEPEFDLRTGRYVSRSRPMGRATRGAISGVVDGNGASAAHEAPPSSALVQRAKGDVATINGAVSPAAEFLRSQRTWQGLGSDYEIAYERDEDGKIRGAAVEEGRSGVAKGYRVGESETT